MAKSEFVYTTYIKTTPEKLWNALTNPEFMRQYWLGAYGESEWKPGSSWRLISDEGKVFDSGEILESQPPKRLVIKWRNEWNPEMSAEGYSRCTFEIEAMDKVTKLTVTHAIDKEASKFIAGVSTGWPKILSNLKSLLETGQVILDDKAKCAGKA